MNRSPFLAPGLALLATTAFALLAVPGVLALGLGRASAADEDPTAKVLAGLAAKDPRVLGTAHFGAHMGRRNVGSLEITIAPTTSGTASYHARTRAALVLEGERTELEEDGLLDVRLGPVTHEAREREGPPARAEGRPPIARSLRPAEKGFRLETPGPEGKPVARDLVADRPLIEGIAARFALLRALDARAKALLRVVAVDADGLVLREVEVDVAGAPLEGEARPLFPVVWRAGDEVWSYLLDPEAPPERRVVRFARKGREALDYVLAESEVKARQDLPYAPRPPAGSPRLCVLEYLEAVEKKDPKKLAPLLDWPALHRRYADRGEGLDDWKKSFLERFAAEEDDDDHAKGRTPVVELIAKLREEPFAPEALVATVKIDGEDGVFRLLRDSATGPWRIAELP